MRYTAQGYGGTYIGMNGYHCKQSIAMMSHFHIFRHWRHRKFSWAWMSWSLTLGSCYGANFIIIGERFHQWQRWWYHGNAWFYGVIKLQRRLSQCWALHKLILYARHIQESDKTCSCKLLSLRNRLVCTRGETKLHLYLYKGMEKVCA